MAGRPRKHPVLGVWMNGQRVGRWDLTATGSHRFAYAPAWLANPLARPLSLSLPLEQGSTPITGQRVEFFFDNLLPDSDAIRRRVASRFASAPDALSLLRHVGRDCVGAIQLLPDGDPPPSVEHIHADPLDEAGVERLLQRCLSGDSRDLDDEDFRISIAGAQEKIALLHHEGRWCRPRGATPTTHILKLPLGVVGGIGADFSSSVENEWLCGKIAREYGFAVAQSSIETFGRQKVLAVRRFDRKGVTAAGELFDLTAQATPSRISWIARLPQEDLCQASGVPSMAKYEERGGPGIATILDLLRGSEQPDIDRHAFMATQLLFWMLAAPDGHAKNFSLFLQPQGTFRLTPLYDILSAWPLIGKGAHQLQWQKVKLAMALRTRNAHYRMALIQRRHWREVASAHGMPDFDATIQDMIAQTPQVIERVAAQLPDGFPAAVSEPVFTGLTSQAARLEAMD